MVECAWGATRKKDSYLKRKYQSLVSKRGKKKALMAVGHKQIIAAYFVLKNKENYKEPVLHNNPKKQQNKAKHHVAQLKELGYDVELKQKN